MAYFITKANVLASAVTFTRTIDEKYIPTGLIEALTIKYIMPILGEDFYDDLVANPDNYTELITYILPVVAAYVKFSILPEIHTITGSSGMVQTTGQNKNPVTRDGLEGLRQVAIDQAELFAEVLHKYLEDNSDDYPLYYSSDNAQNSIVIAGGIAFDQGYVPYDDDE